MHRSTASCQILFFLFFVFFWFFFFNSHYLERVFIDPVLKLSIKIKKSVHGPSPWWWSVDPVHRGCLRTLVHVLSSPVLNGSLLTPSFSLNSLFLHFHSAHQVGCLANFSWGLFLGRELMTIFIIWETGHITSFLAYCICYCSVLLGLKRCTWNSSVKCYIVRDGSPHAGYT